MSRYRSGLATLALFLGLLPVASALTIPVHCDSVHVGNITVNAVPGGVSGGFSSIVPGPPGVPSLAGAALACGEHHFNWYQIVTADNQAPPGSVPPYVDPPPGGYPIAFDNTWADNLPWYYDEYAPPAAPPGRVVNPGLGIAARTHPNLLDFGDFPGGGPGLNLSFRTWLVSLNGDGSLHEFHPGFSWNFSIPGGGGQGTAGGLGALNADPTQAEYNNIIAGFRTAVPEPSTYLLSGCGLLFLVYRRLKG